MAPSSGGVAESSYNRLDVGGVDRRELRRSRPAACAIPHGTEPADGRDRQWEIDRSGCSRAFVRWTASAEMVRSGEERARVAGIFEVRDSAAVRGILEPAGFEIEDGELLIEREVLGGGKSRAFVSSRPATVALLRDLAPHLGDIHGQ